MAPAVVFALTACLFGTFFVVLHAGKSIMVLQKPEAIHPFAVGNEDELFAPRIVAVVSLPTLRSFKFYPFTSDDRKKIHPLEPKTYKKPTKYVKQASASKLRSSSKADGGKKCCGNEWSLLTDKEALTRLVSRPQFYPSHQVYGYRNSDIKPVVEHIEDDLKYDFRTNTHSYD